MVFTDPGNRSPERMAVDVSLREFVFPQDYPAVIAVWENSGPGIHVGRSDSPEEIAKKMRRDPDLFLVAEYNRQVVGTVLGGFDGRRGIVYHLAVVPECRGMGIGERLMAELEMRLRAKGCIRCYLMVVEGNQAALDFYQKRGYAQLSVLALGKDLA